MVLQVPTDDLKFAITSGANATLKASIAENKFAINTGSAAILRVSLSVMKYAVRAWPRNLIPEIVPPTKTSQMRKPYIKSTTYI